MTIDTQAPARPHRKRSAIAMMMVLVACVAVMFWAWRRTSESAVAFDLSRSIQRGTSRERIRAIDDLWRISSNHASTATSALFAALDDPDPEVRGRAMASLFYQLHEVDATRDPTLTQRYLLVAIKNRDPLVRAWAADLLSSVVLESRFRGGTSAQRSNARAEVMTALAVAAQDTDARVREFALRARLRAAGPPATLSLLLAAAEDPDPRVRRVAVLKLVSLAHQSPQAALVVVRALNDPSLEVRAAVAFPHFTAPITVPLEALPDLMGVLQRGWPRGNPKSPPYQTESSVHHQATRYLADLGPAAGSAIPLVLELLPEVGSDLTERDLELMRLLGAIAPGSAEAQAWVPALVAKLRVPLTNDPYADRPEFRSVDAFVWSPQIIAALREFAKRDPSNPYVMTAIRMVRNIDARPTESLPTP